MAAEREAASKWHTEEMHLAESAWMWAARFLLECRCLLECRWDAEATSCANANIKCFACSGSAGATLNAEPESVLIDGT